MECLSNSKDLIFERWLFAVEDGLAEDHEINARDARDAAEALRMGVNQIVGGQVETALRASLTYFASQRLAPEVPDRFLRHRALRALNNMRAALAEAAVVSHAAALRRRSWS